MNKLQKLASLQKIAYLKKIALGALLIKEAELSEEELSRLKDLAAGKNPGYLKAILKGALLGAGAGGAVGVSGGVLGGMSGARVSDAASKMKLTGSLIDPLLAIMIEKAKVNDPVRLGKGCGLVGLGVGAIGGGLHGLYNHILNKERLQELAKLQLAAVSNN